MLAFACYDHYRRSGSKASISVDIFRDQGFFKPMEIKVVKGSGHLDGIIKIISEIGVGAELYVGTHHVADLPAPRDGVVDGGSELDLDHLESLPGGSFRLLGRLLLSPPGN